MSTILIKLKEIGSCQVEHQESGVILMTDAPPEYGGQARSFSSTDLLAAAIGTCIATNLDSILVRSNIPLDAVAITVEKKLAQNPKRVAALDVMITSRIFLIPEILLKLENAARSCAVKRSLHPDIQIRIQFVQPVEKVKG